MSRCDKSKITFNTETLEKIVNDPHAILGDEESFWEDEKPQEYTRMWAEAVNYPIPYDEWRGRIREWANIPPDERNDHIFMENATRIIEGKEEFLRKAVPHLCSYLPKDAKLDITVYFTAFIPSRAFAMGEIVINIAADYWKKNADNILNTLVHEIFHVGYSYCRDMRTEEKLDNETLYGMLDNFQSEGVCTYVGYRALPLFPAPDEKDYKLLDDMAEVRRLLKDLNSVFSKVGVLTSDEIQKLAWEKCVIGRGYYIVGAYMCKVIEEKRGREALIGTLTTGPVSFVDLYNSLVEDEMKVRVKV
jgi:hypothetical protein